MRNLLATFTKQNNFHLTFWQNHPTLLYALTILIGINSSSPWVLLWLCYLIFCKKNASILLLIASMFYGMLHQIPDIPDKELTAIFSPHSLQPHSSPFQKGLQYKGELIFDGHNLPCTIYYRDAKEIHPTASQKYIVTGTLQEREGADFAFKVKEWKVISSLPSLAELRYQTKDHFKKLLSTHLSPRVATLLSSITTGDVEDRNLRYEFARVGLQHILAISGFHFGILIAFLTYFLRLMLSRTWKTLFLFLFITVYYIFVGPSPAVERSYLTALFYLLGKWANLATSGLNLLGMAMGTELIFNPHVAANMGFQLSFLSCFAILLFFEPIENLLQKWIPNRTWSEIKTLTYFARHGYLATTFLRKILSLNIAINLLLLPLILYHFHQFPLLGLIYNIFFPVSIGIALFLLLIALVFHVLFPPVASLFYWLTDTWTEFLLNMTLHPPLAIDFSLRVAEVPIAFIITYLFILSFWRISMPKTLTIDG